MHVCRCELLIVLKGVISAVGPFTDEMLLMDNENASKIVSPSQGVHVILPGYYSPESVLEDDAEIADVDRYGSAGSRHQ